MKIPALFLVALAIAAGAPSALSQNPCAPPEIVFNKKAQNIFDETDITRAFREVLGVEKVGDRKDIYDKFNLFLDRHWLSRIRTLRSCCDHSSNFGLIRPLVVLCLRRPRYSGLCANSRLVEN